MLMRLSGLLYSVVWLEVDSNGSSAEHWRVEDHLFSVPGWWRHWGHVSDTSQLQRHVEPRDFGAWPDSWLIQVGSDRTDTFVRRPNRHPHNNTHAKMHKTHTNLIFLPSLAITLGLPVFFQGPRKTPALCSSQSESRMRLLALLRETLWGVSTVERGVISRRSLKALSRSQRELDNIHCKIITGQNQ